MSDSEKKVNRNMYNISSIKRITRKFLKVSHCSCAEQLHRNVEKKCAARANLLFCQLDLLLFFHHSLALPSLLSISRFYILFEQTINII